MSQFIRKFSYDTDGNPVMEIRRKVQPEGRVYQIDMENLWVFSEEHNHAFEISMTNVCIDIYRHLEVGDFMLLSHKARAQVMGDIATVIQEGIEEFLSMPPEEQDRVTTARTPIGEVILTDKDMGVLAEKEIYADG
jgi:hypothetical protein